MFRFGLYQGGFAKRGSCFDGSFWFIALFGVLVMGWILTLQHEFGVVEGEESFFQMFVVAVAVGSAL